MGTQAPRALTGDFPDHGEWLEGTLRRMRGGWLTPLVVLGLAVAGCTAQRSPERSALPDVAAAVAPLRPCAFVVGDGTGVFVEEVVAGSGSENVLQAGDVVLAIDGIAVAQATELQAQVAERSVGDTVALEVDRSGTHLAVEVTLGASSQDPSRPLMGVMITTRFDEVPLETSTTVDPSALARIVAVNDRLVVIDPLTVKGHDTGLSAPEGSNWTTVEGLVYQVVEGSAAVTDAQGSVVDIGEGVPLRILGSVDGDLVVSVRETDVLTSVRRVDPRSGELWRLETADDLAPIAVQASPDGTRLIVGYAPLEGEDPVFALVDAASGEIMTDLDRLTGGASFGWFDDQRLLAGVLELGLGLFDPADESIEPRQLPIAIDETTRLYATGDGLHVLIVQGRQLLLGGLEEGIETRPLLDRCQIGLVDHIGSGA